VSAQLEESQPVADEPQPVIGQSAPTVDEPEDESGVSAMQNDALFTLQPFTRDKARMPPDTRVNFRAIDKDGKPSAAVTLLQFYPDRDPQYHKDKSFATGFRFNAQVPCPTTGVVSFHVLGVGAGTTMSVSIDKKPVWNYEGGPKESVASPPIVLARKTNGTKTFDLSLTVGGGAQNPTGGIQFFSVIGVEKDPPGQNSVLPVSHAQEILMDLGTNVEVLRGVAFSPDGKRVVTASHDMTAILWDAATGRKVRVLQGHSGFILSVAFHPKANQVLTGSQDKTVILWDAATGHKLRAFQGHTGWVKSVAIGPDGRLILTGSLDKTVALWDIPTGKRVRSWSTTFVHAVDFGPDGTQVVAALDDGTAKMWNVDTGNEIRTFRGHLFPAIAVAFSPDGKQVVTGADDYQAILWDAATGHKFRSFYVGMPLSVFSVAFSPDSKYVITGDQGAQVMLWDAATGKRLRVLKGHAGVVNAVAFSPDGKQILSGAGKTAILWDAATGQKIRKIGPRASNPEKQ
jgi:WD40 repeat protein